MRLTQKKIEEIIVSILGSEGLSLLKHLYGKENISEFDLANKTKKDIKIIRKMLYLLYNHNLVGFTRKKDKQKGWYVYYWTLLPDSLRFNYVKRRRELLTRLKARLEEEQKELFFRCPNDCVRLNFDQSMDFEFHCPECGELITQDTSEEKIAMLTRKIADIEEELEKIRERKKEAKEKGKARRRVVKEKEEKKAAKAAAKKKGVKKKAVKKAVKKKTPAKKKKAPTKKAKVVKKKKASPVKKKPAKKKTPTKRAKKKATKKVVKKKAVKKKGVKKSAKKAVKKKRK